MIIFYSLIVKLFRPYGVKTDESYHGKNEFQIENT